MTKDSSIFWAVCVLSLTCLTCLAAWEEGKAQGRKEITYTCPDLGKDIPILSSTITLDEQDNPVALTCSYLPTYKSYGKSIVRIPGIILDMKRKES